MTRFASHIPVTLLALVCFGVQCLFPLQAAPVRLCLQQLAQLPASAISGSGPAQNTRDELPPCCAPQTQHEESERLNATSCCRDQHPRNAERACDNCGCCIHNPHVEQVPGSPAVTVPDLELNPLAIASISAPELVWNAIAFDEIRPRDPPTQSALCVWLN